MKANIIIIILALAVPTKQYAQTALNKAIAVKTGQTIDMHFDYPELIRVSTWDGNEISIQGQVIINAGENDDAFVIENDISGNVVKIRGEIRNIKNLPQRITVMREGQKMMFRDKAEWEKYQAEHGRGYNSVSWGPDIDITLEVRVPRNITTRITSVYGMVEVVNFSGPLTVEATYGGVDAALVERSVGELKAETNFGQIYSNLDTRFDSNEVTTKDFYMHVSAKPGQGPPYNFESKFGNVYLRKAR
jgi:hypothetical protein